MSSIRVFWIAIQSEAFYFDKTYFLLVNNQCYTSIHKPNHSISQNKRRWFEETGKVYQLSGSHKIRLPNIATNYRCSTKYFVDSAFALLADPRKSHRTIHDSRQGALSSFEGNISKRWSLWSMFWPSIFLCTRLWSENVNSSRSQEWQTCGIQSFRKLRKAFQNLDIKYLFINDLKE